MRRFDPNKTFRGRHFRRRGRDEFDRDPALDFDDASLDEIREKIRGGEKKSDDSDGESWEGEADGTAAR